MSTLRSPTLALALSLLPAAALAQRGADEPAVVTLRLGDAPHPIPGPLGVDGDRVQIGGRRAERAGGRWRFSDDRVIQEVRAAVALDGRFVFVTEDGLVAASDTFVGPLRPLGAVPGARRASSWTRGRLAVLADGAFFTTDGTTLTPAGATPAPARHAAFLDARTGAAVLADGRLVFTRDGAATWAPVDLGRDLALLVAFRDGALRVFTTRGVLALSAAGALSPAPASPDARPAPRSAPDESLAAAWREREPVPDHGATAHARLPDGTFVAVRGGAVRHVDAAGRVLSTRELGGTCTASSWPGGVAVACGDLYRTTDGETWEAVPGPPAAPQPRLDPVVFASDGASVALFGQCEGERFEPRAQALCVRDARGRWRDLSRAIPDAGALHLLRGMRGGDVLVERAGPEGGLVLVDVAAETARPVTFEGVPEGRVQIDGAHLADDGAYVAVVRTERASWYARGAEGAAWSALRLPEGVVAVDFADARRGVALGDRFERLWRTLDGGATWEPLATGVEFNGESPRIVAPPEVRCDARGCSAGAFLFVRGWGPVQAPRERIYGGARRSDVARRPPASFAPLRCESGAEGAPRRLVGRLSTFDHGASRSRQGAVTTLTWRGENGRGAATFTVSHGEPFTVTLAFHAGALVATYRDLVWARGATLRPLGLPRVAAAAGTFSRVEWVTADAEGGGVVALATPAPAIDPPDPEDPALRPLDVQVAFEVSAAGAVVRRRTEVGDPYHSVYFARGLARVGARWGLADIGYDGAVRFAPLDGGAPTPIGALSDGLRPCAAAAPRGAATVRFNTYVPPRGLDAPPYERARVDVELAAGGACLREVAIERASPRRPGNLEYVRLRAEGGALVGGADDGVQRVPMRCEVAP
ncbi:MAG: hypothetical protein U0324_26860 [Polyangiales bacterium]